MKREQRHIILLSIVLILGLVTLACTVSFGTDPAPTEPQSQNQPVDEGDSLQKTQIAQQEIEIGVQQTQLALTQTQMAVQPTQAQPTQAQPTQAPQPTEAPPTEEPQAPEPTQAPVANYPDLETFLSNVDILLYEDMAGDFGTTRFVKTALDQIGVPYTDVKDAQGHFKNALLGGTDWDLIISASESRTGVTGEFFDYMADAMFNGSSIILEVWDMDSFVNGKIQRLLSPCGASYFADYADPSEAEKLLTIHSPGHPVVSIYNENIRMTSLLDYWWGVYDYGDLMQIDHTGDAVIVLGARTNAPTTHGTVVSCVQDRFILQTHSTHTYSKDRSIPLWENYIFTTLLARYFYLYPDAVIE